MKPKIHAFWGILAALVILGSLALCFVGPRWGLLYAQSPEEPKAVVVRFFTALTAQDYEKAYACLGNYESLGLEDEVKGYEAGRMLESLRYSYGVGLQGDCFMREGAAVQKISLRVLDLKALQEALDAAPGKDADGNQLPAPDIDTLLQDARNWTKTGDYEVTLRFDGQRWKIWLEEPLLSALLGEPA